MELFSLRKIYRICPRHRGPGPLALAHGSTDIIKRRSLATGYTTQIKPIESVSRLLISAVHHRSDGWHGWLRPRAAPARARDGTLRPRTAVRQSSSFLKLRWSVFDEVCCYGITAMRGHMFMLTLIGGQWQQSSAMVRRLGWCLSTVRAASGEASAPMTCTKASLSSLLASRLTNCSDRQWKTQIWWLPRVQRVLDLQPKICTICGTIYMGFWIGS
jgi:hypothetical protein